MFSQSVRKLTQEKNLVLKFAFFRRVIDTDKQRIELKKKYINPGLLQLRKDWNTQVLELLGI